jgi:hypothetical protein
LSQKRKKMPDQTDPSPLREATRRPFAFIDSLRKFHKTSRAVLTGVPIYDWTQKRRSKEGLLEPWAFNLRETALAALPAAVLIGILNYLYGNAQTTPDEVAQLTGQAKTFWETLQITNQFFSTLLAPTATTIFVFLAAWGSLKSEDSTGEKRARARHAYLYLNGAYMLVPECCLPVAVSLLQWGLSGEHNLPIGVGIAAGVLLVVSLISCGVVANKAAKRLFQINGYSGRVRHFWQNDRPGDPPGEKFRLAVFLGGSPTVFVVGLGLYSLSWLSAKALTWIKLLIPGTQ